MATYLYGILGPNPDRADFGHGVGSPPGALRLVRQGDLVALVSTVPPTEPEGEGRALRRDLRAHEQAVRTAMESGTILPVSFGTIFDDDRQLIDELLEPHADEFADLLDRFEGLVELTLKAEFVEDAVIRRLLERDLELRAWRDSANHAGGEEQIAFGQALAAAVEDEALVAAEGILARLRPLAADVWLANRPPGTGVLKASFLVDRSRVEEFDSAVEELGSQRAGVIEFDYVGPVPPYSFVNLDINVPAA